MKKVSFLSFLFLAGGLCISAQTFPSGDFNTFETGWNEVGVQPTGWKGSNVNQFSLAKIQEVYEETSGRNGSAVKLVNTAAGMATIGANAPAYITLGSPWVYANIADVKGSDGGTWGGTAFAFRPDAVKGFIKREIATKTTSDAKYCELNPDEVCNILVYLWKGSTTSTLANVTTSADGITGKKVEVKDLDKAVLGKVEATKSSDFALIAQAQYDVPAVTTTEWQEVVIPLEYSSDEVPEKLNIIISAADYFNRPNIGDNNKLWADDFEFVYYSELKELTYNGESVEIPSNGAINLSDQVYDATKLSYTLTGKGATAETTSYDEATAVLTLTVKGNDWSVNKDNQHVYTIQFAKPAPASEVVGQYNRWISVTLGEGLISESANNISLTEGDNGTVTFSLDYFTLAPGGDNLGPVAVPNAQLVYAADGSINITAPSQLVEIPGLDASLPIALSANMTADKKLTASLDIPMAQVKVTVGDIPFTTVEEGKVLKVTGTVSKLGASSVKGESTANVLDLTGATLGEGLATENFAAGANDLFLITADQTLTGNNVVKDGACANFVLTDGEPFYAPEAFTADAISYNRTDLVANGIYTFVLPFAVSTDQVNGAVYELAGITDGVISFTPVADGMLEANKPYLVRATAATLLADDASIRGQVEAVTAATVENAVTGVTHVGAYQTTEVASDGATSWYGYNQEGTFVKALTGTISPFRTALRVGGNGQSSYVLSLDGTITGIVSATGDVNARVDVYTLSGVCVRKNVPAATALDGLDRGIYIVGGQKVSK